MDWLFRNIWDWLIAATFGFIPTWVWVIVAGLLIGWAWKTFGWQGVLGAVAAIVTLGAYRQGWRDRDQQLKPKVPINDIDFDPPVPAPRPKKRKRKTILDYFNNER